MSLFCDSDGCPVELMRRAMNAMIAEGEKRGAKFSATCEHVVTCQREKCRRTVGWKRTPEGDREIPQSVIWGKHDAA